MIEYSFSIAKIKGEETRLLRTKGDKTNYKKGQFHSFSEENSVSKTTYSCKIKDLIKEAKEGENYYSWYTITDFSQIVDHTPETNKNFEKVNASLDYLFMMNDLEPLGDDKNEQNVRED